MEEEPCAVKARNRMLGFHGELRARIGKAYREIKPLEVDRLDRAFGAILRRRERGAAFVGYVVHRLSWDQALPNVNHRTTLGLTQAALAHNGADPGWAEPTGAGLAYKETVKAWMQQSKAIMADREMWLEGSAEWEKLRLKHRDATLRWIRSESQSGSLTKAGPHFFKNFLSCSVRVGRGGE